jgi:hypothetical protein
LLGKQTSPKRPGGVTLELPPRAQLQLAEHPLHVLVDG